MPRHGSLAEQLEAVRLYVTTPDHEPEPLQTNWSTIAANDNDPEDVSDLHVERRWRIKPSIEEIERQIKTGDVEHNDAGQVVRIGKLRFSDGTQTEAGFKLVMGKPVATSIRMPTGAMLGTKDAEEGQLGGEEDPSHISASNCYFAQVFDVKPRPYKGGSGRKRGKLISHEEAKQMLANAYASTDMTKVTFTKCPDGLPAGAPKVADNFLGMQKTTCGDSGSVMWQDIASAKASRKNYYDAVDSLKDKDRAVLDAIVTAKSMAYVGVAIGFSGKTAERRGKAAVIAANDNLMAAIDAYAA